MGAHENRRDRDDLLALALSRPAEALRRAERVLAHSPDPETASYALQAAGIVHRDRGDTATALRSLRASLAHAEASAPERAVDVRATLGATLVAAGRTRAGLADLDRAARDSSGLLRARVLLRRGVSLFYLGRLDEALDDLQGSIASFRQHGDVLWEARTLSNRGRVHVARGALERADHDVQRAQALFEQVGQHLESVDALHTLAAVAYLRGDLPRAMSLFDDAAAGFADTGVSPANFVHDHCELLLAAGLDREALEVVDGCLQDSAASALERAQLLLMSANAALATGDLDGAVRRARAARALFVRQQRPWWSLQSDLLLLRVAAAQGQQGKRQATTAARVAAELLDLRADEAGLAHLLAGDLAVSADRADAHYRAAAGFRHHPSAVVATSGWLALARQRRLAGSSRGVLSACARGLDALDAYRSRIGSAELRALSTQHGKDVADLALLHVTDTGRPRDLLAWTERWRATALAQPPVRPPTDGADDLGAVRAAQHALDEALRDGVDPTEIARERRRLERRVRDQRRRLVGTHAATHRLSVPNLLDELRTGPDGDTTLVELVEVDGTLRVLVARAGRVRGFVVGPVDEALAAVKAARFVLRQTSRGRPADLAGVGERLERTLLGPAARALDGGPVVVAPPGRLHATPWALLPTLRHAPVTVAPSAAVWVRARHRLAPDGGLTLVSGPGMRTGGAEIEVLARENPDATVLRGEDATCAAALAALDGVRLAHVAAHGHFRDDSPLFSALQLADGPLTVHDLETLHRPPHRFVLSACDSGVMVPVGADELLGLSAALLSMGTAGVVASVAEVNDESTATMMVDLHHALGDGQSLATALLTVRDRAAGHPVAEATAASFVGLGV